MRRLAATLALFALISAGPAAAQRDSTLADIRQELSVLYVELQRLKRELSTTGSPSAGIAGGTALERVDLIESELQRLTAKIEELEHRIDRVVTDGTNRIGDLEFRLCELEADCDIADLGETPTLGGAVSEPPAPAQPIETEDPDTGTEMAVGEQADFDRAKAAFDEGDYVDAADQFLRFTETYLGGPLSGAAHFWRGRALEEQGRTTDAARAFLESFSGAPDGPKAPEALLRLGLSLEELGQRSEACVTLGEVSARYPGTEAAAEADAARARLGCS